MRILLTGGSACGKSTFAEQLAANFKGPRYYIATMQPYDQECLDKIAKHRVQRADKGFETIERYTDLAAVVLPKRGVVLLECMCNWLANEMFTETGDVKDPHPALWSGIKALEGQCEHLIVVTNEVGADSQNYDESTKMYVKYLGEINQALAKRFDQVTEMVCGLPLDIKGRASVDQLSMDHGEGT